MLDINKLRMSLFKRNNLVVGFEILLWTISGSVILYLAYKYTLNEDLSVVDIIKFYQGPTDVFPVLSLCFMNPFPKSKLQNNDINATNYVKYLKGQYFDETMHTADYQSIVMDVSEYVEEIYIKWKNGSYKSYTAENYGKKTFYPTYSGFGFFQERFYQCFGMNIPHEKNVQIFSVLLRNEVFLNTYTPKIYEFLTFLHYPNQILRSVGSMKYKWDEKLPNASLDISFRVKDMEVIHRRNKDQVPCNENWDSHDDHIVENHVDDVGCRPPYLLPTNPSKICSTQQEMKKSQFNLRADEYGTNPPCQSMDKIMFTYEEDDISGFPWANPGTTWIGVNLFIDHFKMIEHTR